MLKKITLALNPMDKASWTHHEVDDVRAFLKDHFGVWPAHMHIYHEQVSEQTEVTPTDEYGIERLGKLEGPFFVIQYPGDITTAVYFLIAAIVVAAVVLGNLPSPVLKNTQTASPNNELSDRTNKARPQGRIPDIFGTRRSTPDLLALPYKVFINHQEVEYAYMCIGRGTYEVSDVRDDTTLISEIVGSSVEVYGPNTSPNSGDTPQLAIGAAIDTLVLDVKKSNSVNGQVLRTSNEQSITGVNNIRFITPNIIQTTGFDFTEKFTAGDPLVVYDAIKTSGFIEEGRYIFADSDGSFKFQIDSSTPPTGYTIGDRLTLIGATFYNPGDEGGGTYYDLSGTYEIEDLEVITVPADFGGDNYYYKITLVDPEVINSSWPSATPSIGNYTTIRVYSGTVLYDLAGTYTISTVTNDTITLVDPGDDNAYWDSITVTDYISPYLSSSGPKWIGPFTIDKSNTAQLFANFVALNGLYKDDGSNQIAFDVVVELEVTPIDEDGDPSGDPELFQATILGSSTLRDTRAVTMKAAPTFVGASKVRARRVTPSDTGFSGTVVDEVKWRDLYAVAPVEQEDFGNVTTVQSVTFATSGALSVKERKLNMEVTRQIPLRVSGTTFTSDLHSTNKAEEIFSFIALDPYLGNRTVQEIDFDSIYDTMFEVRGYFDTDLAGEFCYTFDTNNLSFEETAQAVANAVFCTAYRRGSVLKFKFEKLTEISSLIFNHRNKLPQSEVRTIRFGNQDNYDGVNFSYIDPVDDAQVTLYIPEDRSAVTPKEIDSLGIRSFVQAYFHAWRHWNKIRYQNTISEFQATQEAELVIPQDRILVADNTRSNTQDGEVLAQDGLILHLSQPVVFDDGMLYTIFLQLYNGTVQAIAITAGDDDEHVVLAVAPAIALVLDPKRYARTTYMIVGDTDGRTTAFLVAERTPNGNYSSAIKAINYDNRYYAKDQDYALGVIT